MAKPRNAMEIFELLDKSNCRDCGYKTCLAFAGAVFRGQATLDQCPKLDSETVARFSEPADGGNDTEANRAEHLEELKREAAALDFREAAERVGGRFHNDRLTVKVMGKDFTLNPDGTLSADIHVNPWVAVPFLDHVLNGKGADPAGEWVSFRELSGGRERYPLFQKRCEEALKRVADVYTDLFDDMVHIFNGKEVDQQFASDISMVLHPLPKVPLMVCYWSPEEGLGSSLNIFFDRTADENLDIGSIFSLGAGLAQMFEKLAVRHGYSVPASE